MRRYFNIELKLRREAAFPIREALQIRLDGSCFTGKKLSVFLEGMGLAGCAKGYQSQFSGGLSSPSRICL